MIRSLQLKEKLQSSILLTFLTVLLSFSIATGQEKKPKPAPRASERLGWEMGKIAPEVTELSKAKEEIDVIVYLKSGQKATRKASIEQEFLPKMEQLRSKIEGIAQKSIKLKTNGLKPSLEQADLEKELVTSNFRGLSETDRKELRGLQEQLDTEMSAMRKRIVAEEKRATETMFKQVEREFSAIGSKNVKQVPMQNAIAMTIPASGLKRLAENGNVVEITYNVMGSPELDVSVNTVGAPSFWNGGIDGGIWDIGIVDSGVEEDHVALSSHDFWGAAATTSSHGTHVAGIVASTDATDRGVAFGLDGIISGLAGNMAQSMNAFNSILFVSPDDADVANHSWGYGNASSDDTPFSQFFDGLVDDFWFPITKSAGNSGPGANTITYPGNSYNLMVVGNMDDQGTVSRFDDQIRASSSRGPTAGGRKKPDIVAPGTNIRSSILNDNFGNLTGTSMAAPHVAGAFMLLLDDGKFDPRIMKAILINTATSWDAAGPVSGSNWNSTYGWGYLDLRHAYFHRDDYFSGSVTPRNTGTDYRFYTGRNFSGDKATLVWHRHIGPGAVAQDLSDLDLYLFNEDTNAEVDRSWSAVDNVEQVSGAATNAVIKVEAWDTSFDGISAETYALATEENYVEATPPTFTIVPSITNPVAVTPFVTTVFTYTITNTGDITAHDVNVELVSAGLADVWGPSSTSFDLEPGESRTVSWGKMGYISGTYPAVVTASSYSYYETFFNSNVATVTIP